VTHDIWPRAVLPQVVHRWSTPSGAVVAELAAGCSAVDLFVLLAGLPQRLFLDSARPDPVPVGPDRGLPRLGRYSFVAADPIHLVTLPRSAATPAGAAAAIAAVGAVLADLRTPTIPALPPFQGGMAGLLSYDFGLATLDLPPPPGQEDVPLVALGAYDVVFAFDHDLGRGWAISQGLPARGPSARRARAGQRLDELLGRLGTVAGAGAGAGAATPAALPGHALPGHVLPGHALPGHALPGHPGIRSSHDPAGYRAMVLAAIDMVRAGDIFQVNLAQRLSVAATCDPTRLVLAARAHNPAPFAASFETGGLHLASMSPERFLQVRAGVVRMHPIKGTRRVIDSPEADLFAGDDLAASAKDRAENVMIVDLVRNDLSRVCTPASVRVEALCRLERYACVQHLVSIVAGRLRPGAGPLDAIRAAVPGGSVTGAPKHRACEIISLLEGSARGPYCGSLGYVGFDGTADFNLLIRTLVARAGRIECAVGGGITARSDPAAEHAETLHKAEGMLRVLGSLGLTGNATG
jgi:para-aminobenzoate synthetase component 1